jgi:uncharacterized membrane protein
MASPTQTQLDAFARRLRALETELEELRRQAAAETVASPEEAPAATTLQPPVVPDRLRHAHALLTGEATKQAVRELDRLRAQSLDAGSITELEEMLELLGHFPTASVQRLTFSINQNIRFLRSSDELRDTGPGAPQRAGAGSGPARTTVPWPPAPRQPREPLVTSPEGSGLELADLLGPRALAIAGGIVTLLGIVFFFVLAVNRGWIGPAGRVGLGAAASASVFLAGLELRRRYGPSHSALAAVAAGIAGGYATLLAAASLYGMLPDYAALAVAAGIAGTGVVTALGWRAQMIGGLGLIGAMLVPVAVVAQGGLTALGSAFVAVVLAASGIVALRERWNTLLIAAMAVSAPQIAALLFRPQYEAQAPPRIVLLAAAFSLLYLAIGIGYQLRSGGPRLGQLATAPITGSALLAAGAAERLYGTAGQRGPSLLAIAVFYACAAALFFPRRSAKDLSALLAAVAFTLGAIGLGQLLSGQPLAYAWAGEAAALAWLARRTREVRFQLWSAIYALLALAHVLLIDAPPKLLFTAGERPLHGAPPAAALALVATVFARYARPWMEAFVDEGGLFGLFAPQLRAFQAGQRYLRAGALWLASVASTYALSLAVLSLFTSFNWGHVALSAIWSTLGLAILFTGLRRKSRRLYNGALVWLGTAGLIVIAHGAHALAPTPRAASFIVVAAAFLVAAFGYQLFEQRDRLAELTAGATPLSLGLSWDALATLLHGRAGVVDLQGAGLFALAVLYAALAAAVFRRREQRDFATLLGAAAVILAATAAAMLLTGTDLVLAWAAGGASLAWLSARAREPRLLLPAIGYLAAALVHALALEAPPNDLFSARTDPATGVPAALIVAVAIGIAIRYSRNAATYPPNARSAAWWTSGVLSVYAVSLSTLELAQRAFPQASLQTDFQRGHTAVSAFWGALGLGLLYLGLTRWRSLRIAGFALFAVSLAKIFLYDLPSLSSITRALSFLAVGAVLLLGGFFYQRLSTPLDEDHEDQYAQRAGTP